MNRIYNSLFIISFGAAMTFGASAQTGMQSGQDPQQSGGTVSNTKQSAGMASADSSFVKKAARGGLAEVELGQLAVEKASSEDVKKFGQRMVDDHSKANDELKQVAAQEHIDLPQEPRAKDKATKARLEKLSGAEFDHAYMADMVKDHKADVAEFAHASKTAKDPSIKSFAEKTLPTLREHLKEAERIAPTQKAEVSHPGNSAQ